MEKDSLRHKRLVLLATIFVFAGLAFAAGPAGAQTAPRAPKPIATITVTASPLGNFREIERLTIYGNKFLAVSASIPVPYGDLNLRQAAGATELGRRVKMAARMACEQIDRAYPPTIYISVGTDDCATVAADKGLAEVGTLVASLKK